MSKMKKLKVKVRGQIAHRNIAVRCYRHMAFRACDKSKSYC
jgi:hypothetical protein